MKIRKQISKFIIITSMLFLIPAVSFAQEEEVPESGINSGNHGLHLRGALGAGKIFWGYIDHGSGSGDLGTGSGAIINLAAMYNYSILGLELNLFSGNIDELEWNDKNSSGVPINYTSQGSGNYTVFDFKFGTKLFTEPGDMGYTYLYAAKRFWSSERKETSRELNGAPATSSETRKAEGDGWIFGYRDFSTIGAGEGLAFVLQSGFFAGKAAVTSMTANGAKVSKPVNESLNLGAELAMGVAFENTGFSVVGGFRGDINFTTFKDPAAPVGEESIFGFGDVAFFIEAGMMF